MKARHTMLIIPSGKKGAGTNRSRATRRSTAKTTKVDSTDITMFIPETPRRALPIMKHAYGEMMDAKFNTGDYVNAYVSTGAGVLGGMATGAALGSIVPGVGTVVGGVVGGLAGLAKGIFGGKKRARARANAYNADLTATRNAMANKEEMDQIVETDSFDGFYGNGGFMRRRAGGGMIPLASDAMLAEGPSHEQGGIQVTPTDEIEGGETMMNDTNGTMVFSDRLKVPGYNMTFAEVSEGLMRHKGLLESKLDVVMKNTKSDMDVVNNPKAFKLPTNSAKRRLQISETQLQEFQNEINNVDASLDNLFNTQQQMNGEGSEGEDDMGQYRYGGIMKRHALGDIIKNPSAMSFGADMLNNVSNMIISNQMSKLTLPKQRHLESAQFNTNVDVSNEIAAINDQADQARTFINRNVANPLVRRANMMSINNRINQAYNQVYGTARRERTQLENTNVASTVDTINKNRGIDYENAISQYNKSMSDLERDSQIVSQFSESIGRASGRVSQQNSNALSFMSILSKMPQGEAQAFLNNFDESALRNLIGSNTLKTNAFGGYITPRARRMSFSKPSYTNANVLAF